MTKNTGSVASACTTPFSASCAKRAALSTATGIRSRRASPAAAKRPLKRVRAWWAPEAFSTAHAPSRWHKSFPQKFLMEKEYRVADYGVKERAHRNIAEIDTN